MTPSIRLLLGLLLLAPVARAQFCPLSAGETERRIVSCKDGVSMAQCVKSARAAGCAVVRELALINAVVIEVPLERLAIAKARLAGDAGVERVDASPVKNWLKSVRRDNGALPDFAFPDPGVLPRFAPTPKTAPEGVADPEQPWGVQRVKAAAAWPRSRGKGVKVAVIDTGVDRAHKDLAGVLVGGFNALDKNKPEDWHDEEGHGTHVAGTIGARRDGQGVVGVAPEVSLYAVRVLDKNGDGTYDDVIAGIEWAVANGMQVANMSLGADEGSEPLHRAVQAAAAKGLVIVAASGNTGSAVNFPARYPETIAVGASDKNDKLAFFSSRGPEVDFIAPGMDVPSLRLGGGDPETMSGTSMAAPHVSGLAAIALSLGARDVRLALGAASTPLPGLDGNAQGGGLADAGRLRANDSMLASR